MENPTVHDAQPPAVELSYLDLHYNYVQMTPSPYLNLSVNIPLSLTTWQPHQFRYKENIEGPFSLASAAMYLKNTQNATFINCAFIKNKSTGLITLNSVLSFVGNTTFRGNLAQSGAGGGMLLSNSYMLLD